MFEHEGPCFNHKPKVIKLKAKHELFIELVILTPIPLALLRALIMTLVFA